MSSSSSAAYDEKSYVGFPSLHSRRTDSGPIQHEYAKRNTNTQLKSVVEDMEDIENPYAGKGYPGELVPKKRGQHQEQAKDNGRGELFMTNMETNICLHTDPKNPDRGHKSDKLTSSTHQHGQFVIEPFLPSDQFTYSEFQHTSTITNTPI